MSRVVPPPAVAATPAQAQLQQIVDNTSAAMFVKDLDGRFLFVNREFERIKGLPGHAIVGRLDRELFPDSAAELRRNDEQVIAELRALDFEEQVTTADGQRIYLAHKFPLVDAAGKAYAVCGVASDITDRKRNEEALRAAALAVTTAEGDRVFSELVRYLATILRVDVAMIAVHVDEGRTRMRTLAACLDGKPMRNFEYPLEGSPCRHVVGREFRFVGQGVHPEFPPGTLFSAKRMDSYAALPLNDAKGEPLGLIATMQRAPMHDAALAESMLKIFAMRAVAEIERTRSEAALRASEASYRAIFETSEDAIFVHDWQTGAIVDANPKACATYGYSVDEFRGLPVSQISAGVPPYTAAEAASWLAKAKGGAPVAFEWHRRNRDGTLRWDEVYLKAAQIAGTPRILAFTRDITARKAAEDRLRASEAQYRAIFNASADALVLWNSRLDRVDVNPAYERMYGYSRDEVLSGAMTRMMPPEVAERRHDIVRRTLAGENCHEELDSSRRDGSSFKAEVRTIRIQHRDEPHVLAMIRDVTERKRAELAIRASEQQYRAIFNASMDGLLLWDADHRVVDVNDAFLALHGFARDELVGSSDMTFIPDELRDECSTLLPRVIAGEPCHCEVRGRRKDGSEFDAELHGTVMEYQGRPHVLITMRDITARREAERRILASEKRYRLLFEMESDAILVTDAETLQLLDGNRAAEELWGYSREELLMLKATDLSAEAEATRDALQGEAGTLAVPIRWHRRQDGTVFPVEITLNRFELDGRKIVLSAIRDITERRQREEDLAVSEGRLRATVEAAFDCVVGMDSRGNLIEFNPAAERAFGRRREDVLGRPLAELLIPPDKRDAHTAGLARFREARTGPFIGRRVETTALRSDGTEFPVELAVSVARAGEEDLFVGYLRDISDRHETERRRAELEAQLRQAQKMEAIGHLTGGIAHDFNNLLTSIMGYVTLASERTADAADAKLANYLDQAQVACERARDLIQQMLTFSRGRRGEPRPLAVAPLVRESVKLLRASFPATVVLRTDLDDDAPQVLLDPVQFEQVLMNLAINARDAMRSSGEIRVSMHRGQHLPGPCTSCRKPVIGEMVELCVADTGPGVSPEVKERMFEPFFTTKEVGKGSGMGLSTVHGIVHEHGGHVVVESHPGTGARFRVFLPARKGSAEATARPRPSSRAALPRASLRGHVAIIDDEMSIASFMSDLLEQWGLSVATFADARAALDALAGGAAFDLIVTDQTMPGMTGLEFARAARDRGVRVPIVLYTGYDEGLAADEVAQAGIAALVRKPIDPQALLTTLEANLAHAAAAQP